MKEYYLDKKVVQISGWRQRRSPEIERMYKERTVAAVCNKVHQEFMQAYNDFESKMISFVSKTLREELK